MTLNFPGENQIEEELSRRLAGHFDHAKRFLRFWLEADKDSGIARSNLPPIVIRVLVSMSVKAARQFRTVIELCKRGEGTNAASISRSMFETALVIGFVLKPRFTPRAFSPNGTAKKHIMVPGVSLTREFRATLYVAHHVFNPERFATRHAARPGMKRQAKRYARLVAQNRVPQQYAQAIGNGWTKILMTRPYTYSGLSISDLARSLGRPFPEWYDQVYGPQSEHVHAGDVLHYLQIEQDGATKPRWHDSIEYVRGTLRTAIVMFHTTTGMLAQHMDFGIVMNTALHGFADEYEQLIKAE